MVILYTLLVALASELSFLVGLIIGSIVSMFAAMMVTPMHGLFPPAVPSQSFAAALFPLYQPVKGKP
jgi:hypothetical protein